tara:strand:+ start:23 stop:313 length:291 start_codon:yes stop_codon:yes gene_type:complete
MNKQETKKRIQTLKDKVKKLLGKKPSTKRDPEMYKTGPRTKKRRTLRDMLKPGIQVVPNPKLPKDRKPPVIKNPKLLKDRKKPKMIPLKSRKPAKS